MDDALTAQTVELDEAIAKLPAALAKVAWSASHTTFSPNMCRAGVKTNVIPDVVDIEVDIRTVPGDDENEVRRKLFSRQASVSPTGTPLWDVLGRVGDDERIDVESLALTTQAWLDVCELFLG